MLAAVLLGLACRTDAPVADLSAKEVAGYIRSDVADPLGWATDVRAALQAARRPVTEEHVCQVLAIVEQESGYEADPAVPNLPSIVEAGIDDELARLGPLAPFGKDALLNHTPDGATSSLLDQLRALRTERDLDRWYRDVIAYHEAKAPLVGKAARLFFPRLEERLNPVHTAGSMQVSVSFAQEVGRQDGLDAKAVREALYTRAGGLRYGVARLFGFEAGYDRPVYRFADYNAGMYASRNAQFQAMLADLTDTPIATDGDLLRYDDRGRPSGEDGESTRLLVTWATGHGLAERRVRADLEREKELRFEETETWTSLRAAWVEKRKRTAAYAKVPDVHLDSPKFSKDLSTKWFAEHVSERFGKCLRRR
jgi:hypothetical protein